MGARPLSLNMPSVTLAIERQGGKGTTRWEFSERWLRHYTHRHTHSQAHARRHTCTRTQVHTQACTRMCMHSQAAVTGVGQHLLSSALARGSTSSQSVSSLSVLPPTLSTCPRAARFLFLHKTLFCSCHPLLKHLSNPSLNSTSLLRTLHTCSHPRALGFGRFFLTFYPSLLLVSCPSWMKSFPYSIPDVLTAICPHCDLLTPSPSSHYFRDHQRHGQRAEEHLIIVLRPDCGALG